MAGKFDHSENFSNLSFAISYYRKKKGLTQEQLAEALDISRQHIGAIEAQNMDRGLSLDTLFDIATVLEIEPYLLFKFKVIIDSED